MVFFRLPALLGLTLLLLAGCSSTPAGSEGQTNPFLVFSYPPLTTPPDLFLRPPLEGREGSDIAATTEAVLELTDDEAETLTAGERALLELLSIDPTPIAAGEEVPDL